MKTRAVHVVLLMVISAMVGYYVGVSKIDFAWKYYQPQITIVGKEPPSSMSPIDFNQFWTVWQKLQNEYYDKTKIDSQKMLNGAISGMVESLDDPYTMYLPRSQNDDFKSTLAGKFQGIGAELGMNAKQIIVVAPIDGSPASKAGIKPEDAILKVNGVSTFGWTLGQAVEKIRGPKDTTVKLTILHKSAEKAVELSIVRDTISIKSVAGWVKEIKDIPQVTITPALVGKDKQRIAYIRLSQFGDSTNTDWTPVVNNIVMSMQNEGKITGLVLDLRSNPGGYLTEATYVSSEFLRSGVVVIQDRGNGQETAFSVNRKGLLLDIPMVVLINKGSASAAEIVSGALRDHKRAKLVGDISFGKGTIQTSEDLGEGAGIHVTVAKWLTPNKTWVHGKGLTPDVSIEYDPKLENRDNQLEKAIEELVK